MYGNKNYFIKRKGTGRKQQLFDVGQCVSRVLTGAIYMWKLFSNLRTTHTK